MQICPHCASENIFYSKKRAIYFCEDCENSFDTPYAEKGMRIFLSYGHDKNAPLVRKIKDFLVDHGYDVWIDTSEISPGKNWREIITNGLIGSNGVISFLSKHSVRDPGVCLDELRIALCLKHSYLKTVLLEDEKEVAPPSIVCNTQWIDMSEWEAVSNDAWDSYFSQKMSELLLALNSDEAVKFNKEMEFLNRKLKAYDSTVKEQRLLKQTFVGRSWLTERVQEWFEKSKSSSFMIYGVPGAGKSAFAANLVQYNPDVLAAIYFEYDHTELCETDNVIRTLAFKLAASLSDYRRILCNIYEDESAENNMDQLHGAALFDQIILNPIQCCIDGQRSKGMVVLDGIDETTVEIANLLISKSKQFPNWIKFIFTSRHDESTASLFDADDVIILDNSHEDNLKDLTEYFAYRLEQDPECETVHRLANKSEGSFMYACAFCDAIDNGSMVLSDESILPRGLNNFYYVFFKRLFPTREAFFEIRPLLELLSTDDDVPEDAIAESLELDRYGIWELRMRVKSLVTNTESICSSGSLHKFKAIKFVHKSIKDWLTDERLAAEFFVDVQNGYRALARYAEKKNLHQKALELYCENNYVKWLILGGEYNKAKETLISSFDSDEMSRDHDPSDYMEYYKFLGLWQWADMFPLDYPIEDLVETFKEMALYPLKYMVSSYTHRSTQIVLFILRNIINSGRFKNVLFAVMQNISLAAYFTSRASDDGETRDGWDKYYMARDAAVCLKKLDKANVPVPEAIRHSCEKMKLTFNYRNGNPEGGMFYKGPGWTWSYGILNDPELFKDVCILNDAGNEIGCGDIRALQTHYNTTSLRLYLANSDEEDLDFIKLCVQNHADISTACAKAIEDINNNFNTNVSRRIEFINSLL